MAWPSWVGSILSQVVKGVLDYFRTMWHEDRLNEAESHNEALKHHHENEQEVEAAEERIASATRDEMDEAEKDTRVLSHEEMLDHLRNG